MARLSLAPYITAVPSYNYGPYSTSTVPASFSTAFSANGSKFAVASQEGVVVIWDVRSTKPLKVIQTDKTRGSNSSSMRSGNQPAWSDHWDWSRGSANAPGWGVRSIKFSPRGVGQEVLTFTEVCIFSPWFLCTRASSDYHAFSRVRSIHPSYTYSTREHSKRRKLSEFRTLTPFNSLDLRQRVQGRYLRLLGSHPHLLPKLHPFYPLRHVSSFWAEALMIPTVYLSQNPWRIGEDVWVRVGYGVGNQVPIWVAGVVRERVWLDWRVQIRKILARFWIPPCPGLSILCKPFWGLFRSLGGGGGYWKRTNIVREKGSARGREKERRRTIWMLMTSR